MNPEIKFHPPSVRPGERLTVVVEWKPMEDVRRYEVTIAYPEAVGLGLPREDGVTRDPETSYRHTVRIPAHARPDDYVITATVRAGKQEEEARAKLRVLEPAPANQMLDRGDEEPSHRETPEPPEDRRERSSDDDGREVRVAFKPGHPYPHGRLTTIVTWQPSDRPTLVAILYPKAFQVRSNPFATRVGPGTGGYEHTITLGALADGEHLVEARVEPEGERPRDGSGSVHIGGDAPAFVWQLKQNFDEKVDALTGEAAKAAKAIRDVSVELRASRSSGIRLERAAVPKPDKRRDEFWNAVRSSAQRLRFPEYQDFLKTYFCNRNVGLPGTMRMPFSQVDTYLRLKAFTELFLLSRVGVLPRLTGVAVNANNAIEANGVRAGFVDPAMAIPTAPVRADLVLDQVLGTRPYLRTVLDANPDLNGDLDGICDRLRYPVFLELIWSYWHEEAMLVQSMLKLSHRFQNRSSGAGQDPLAQLEIDPLRPLNNILWGWVQDEQHRLSVRQRAFEYLHQYGLTLEGRAVGRLPAADSRTRFLQAFHNGLYQAVQFHRQSDDTTVHANASPLLFALRDLQFVLAEGAHNQYGDLPWNARLEMLMEQWMLSRPEVQDFLRGRRMTPYPEAWMGSVDAMKSLQGWTGTSVVHFNELAYYGEQLVLSVREGGALTTGSPIGSWVQASADDAATWAIAWRTEIDGYIHAYRAATGIDLTVDPSDPKFLVERDTPPSVHLQRRAAGGRR